MFPVTVTTFRAIADIIHDGLADFEIALLVKIEIINKKRYPGGLRGRGQTTGKAEATLRVLEKTTSTMQR